MNIIIQRCQELADEGYSISSLRAERIHPTRWRVLISMNTFVPLGEGGNDIATVDHDHLPEGVSVHGWERVPDHVIELPCNEEQIEAMIHDLAIYGKAEDVARFDGELPGYPHYLTKPNRWFKP